MEMNSTFEGVAALAQVNPLVFTILIALLIIFVLFVLAKRFRQFVYGCMVLVPLIIIFKISSWIVQENLSGNIIPTKYLIFGTIFVVGSVFVGMLVSKFSFFRKLDEAFGKSPQKIKKKTGGVVD